MSFHNLFKNVEVRRLTVDGTNYILTAGTSDVSSNSVDTLGYEGVAFMCAAGVISASGSVTTKVQESSDDAVADAYTDVAGTAHVVSADTDDNKVFLTDIFRPEERYVRLTTTRGDGGNSVIDGVYVFLFRSTQNAVTQGSTVYALKTLNHPVAGTA